MRLSRKTYSLARPGVVSHLFGIGPPGEQSTGDGPYGEVSNDKSDGKWKSDGRSVAAASDIKSRS
eukprot:5629097-Pyramimonas_sp.AAC.1